jgi:hypothetical protein
MNRCRETMEMGVPPGNRPTLLRDWFRGVPERYVAGADTRGRQEGCPSPRSQQVIHGISGLMIISRWRCDILAREANRAFFFLVFLVLLFRSPEDAFGFEVVLNNGHKIIAEGAGILCR